MRVLLFAALLCSVYSITSCGSKKSFDAAKVKVHIDSLNKTYGKRFGSNEPKFYEEKYCKDAKVFPSKMPTVEGREAIRTFYWDDGRNATMSNIIVTATNVYGCDDMVVEEGLYDFPDGKGGTFDTGKFIVIWKNEDGKWKMYREIWNTNLPDTR